MEWRINLHARMVQHRRICYIQWTDNINKCQLFSGVECNSKSRWMRRLQECYNKVCYFSMSLHLSHGFKLSFKKSDFWGFWLFIWKIMNIWIHICVKHRKLCYIYEIIAKNARKREHPPLTNVPSAKCSFLSISLMVHFSVVDVPFFLHFLL